MINQEYLAQTKNQPNSKEVFVQLLSLLSKKFDQIEKAFKTNKNDKISQGLTEITVGYIKGDISEEDLVTGFEYLQIPSKIQLYLDFTNNSNIDESSKTKSITFLNSTLKNYNNLILQLNSQVENKNQKSNLQEIQEIANNIRQLIDISDIEFIDLISFNRDISKIYQQKLDGEPYQSQYNELMNRLGEYFENNQSDFEKAITLIDELNTKFTS
ncbi:hypothetical protein HC766_04235 [Candidatus Gracilibacteria bacterium]|nr:hypothetical protein [Candidatus Gracilibacteria bacterium]NJS41534.1 hypothetical protein [Candidatus Gracilibacteria bacterium]